MGRKVLRRLFCPAQSTVALILMLRGAVPVAPDVAPERTLIVPCGRARHRRSLLPCPVRILYKWVTGRRGGAESTRHLLPYSKSFLLGGKDEDGPAAGLPAASPPVFPFCCRYCS